MRLGFLLVALTMNGCALLPTVDEEPEVACVESADSSLGLCSVEPWLDYWAQLVFVPWQERQTQIAGLSNSDEAKIKQILLSQPADTPYQQRLRAQHLILDVQASIPEAMSRLLSQLIYPISQRMLELQSERVNLQKQMLQKDQLIQQQQRQIEQILKLEQQLSQLEVKANGQ